MRIAHNFRLGPVWEENGKCTCVDDNYPLAIEVGFVGCFGLYAIFWGLPFCFSFHFVPCIIVGFFSCLVIASVVLFLTRHVLTFDPQEKQVRYMNTCPDVPPKNCTTGYDRLKGVS